ncbi:TonB-dependent receptor [soil metagenome]
MKLSKLAIVVLLSALCHSSYSQTNPIDTTTSVNLNVVEIKDTSNQNKSSLSQPASIVMLKETELKRGTGLYLDDAINSNVPGVYMGKRTISAGQQFNIRGYGNGMGVKGVTSNFDSQGCKVYLNNIPITDAEGITLLDDIDYSSIGEVEITKGPAGSLYGLAIAGAVNLKTIQPPSGKTQIGQDVLIGSYGLQRYTTHLQFGGEHSSLSVNYGKQLFDGYMVHTASHKDFVNVIGNFQPNTKQTISTYFGYSNSYDQRHGEETIGQYDTLNYSGNPKYIKNNAHSEVISFRGGLSHAYRFNEHLSNTTSVFGCGAPSNVSSAGGWTDKRPINYGSRSTFDMKFSLNDKFDLTGTAGGEAQQQYSQTMGYSMVADSSNLNNYNIIGALKSNQASISSTYSVFTEWTLKMPHAISLTAGIGYSSMSIKLQDHFYVSSNNNPSNPNSTNKPTEWNAHYGNMFSPHIALNKVFSNKISGYVSYSKGYKAPVASNIIISTTGELNTGLKPEVGNQFEIGTKGVMLGDKLTYQIAVFNTKFTNKMTAVAVPFNSTTTLYSYLVNAGGENNTGVEALVKYTVIESKTGFFKSVTPFANFCYSDFHYENFKYEKIGKDVFNHDSIISVDYSGNSVAGVPPITFNAGIDVITKIGVYANVNYSYRDAVFFTSDELHEAKSYSLLNAKIGIQKNLCKHFDVDAYFGANNITGSQYYFMLFVDQLDDAYIPAPYEINFFGGVNLRYTF